MATAVPGKESSDDIDKTVWNFKIYTLLELVKDLTNSKDLKVFEVFKKKGKGLTEIALDVSQKYFDFEDCFVTNQSYESIEVGSISEGVPIYQFFRDFCDDDDITNEDIDFFFESDINMCFRDVIAIEGVASESSQSMDGQDHLLMLDIVSSTVATGHVNLALPASFTEYTTIPGLRHLCVKDENGTTVLSSELLVNEIYNIMTLISAMLNVQRCHNLQDGTKDDMEDSTFHTSFQFVGQAGPAVHTVTCIQVPRPFTNNKHLFLVEDVSLSVLCKTWPKCASKWSLREKKSGWPTKELIEKVIADGCHLVPKYDPFGKHSTSTEASERAPMTSWRFSFSLAEKTLMTSITDDQRMCYIIFKYLFSRFIKVPSIITTYTAKTLFLWELENVPADQWRYSQIGKQVKCLIEKLRYCILDNFCEHYFIEKCNILQQMDDQTRKATLEVSFPMLYEELNDEPIPDTGVIEVEPDFPLNLTTTYKSFYPVLVYLRSLSAQAKGNLDPSQNLPSSKTISDFLDNTDVLPIEMPELLIYLVMLENIYKQTLTVPESLLQQQKVFEIIEFLKRSTTDEVFEESLKDLDIELKFLHLQYRIIDETERFLTENPTFFFRF